MVQRFERAGFSITLAPAGSTTALAQAGGADCNSTGGPGCIVGTFTGTVDAFALTQLEFLGGNASTRDPSFSLGTDSLGISWTVDLTTRYPLEDVSQTTLERVDGDVFDLTAFTAQLLANTAGTGGSFEVVAFLNGQEGFNDPLVFDASGIAGNTFSYDTSPNPLGSTALLTGFDKYTIDLFVDFALVDLAVEGAPIPEPSTFSLLALGVIALALRSRAGSGLRAAATRGSGTALTTVSVAAPGGEKQIG